MNAFAVCRYVVILALALATCTFNGCSEAEPSGTYQATAPGGEEGTMTLDFQKGRKVKVTLESPMGKFDFTCDYKLEGDKVVISPPDGSPMSESLTLTRTGSGYEATDGGQTLLFTRK